MSVQTWPVTLLDPSKTLTPAVETDAAQALSYYVSSRQTWPVTLTDGVIHRTLTPATEVDGAQALTIARIIWYTISGDAIFGYTRPFLAPLDVATVAAPLDVGAALAPLDVGAVFAPLDIGAVLAPLDMETEVTD